MTVAGVVLAAGASNRLGRPKQLIAIGGEPLVRRAARAVASSRCTTVAVVVGAHAREVTSAIVDLEVTILPNPNWSDGIASSIRTAVAWAISLRCDGILLTLCDQPHLTSSHLDDLLECFSREKRPIGSAYDGVVGAPAVFGHSIFPELAELHGDRGAGVLLRRNAGAVPWPEGALDLDTEADVAMIHSSCDDTRR